MDVVMKRIRLERWASSLQPPRIPRLYLHQRCPFSSETRPQSRRPLVGKQSIPQQWQQKRGYAAARRRASSAATAQVEDAEDIPLEAEEDIGLSPRRRMSPYDPELRAPSHLRATRSGKLSALHSRLSLPSKLPLQTLARCLIDSSADPRQDYNNTALAILGQDLLGYYTTEHLLCHYPRLPMPVLFAAQYAYVGPATLGALRAEWGVEVVAAPGQEVDPGLLQLKRVTPGNALSEDGMTRVKDMPSLRRLDTGRKNEDQNYRRGISSRIVYDDQFGDLQTGLPEPDEKPYPGAPAAIRDAELTGSDEASKDGAVEENLTAGQARDAVTVEAASASFIRALTGALHLHAGPAASKAFHDEHILSRHMQLHNLFAFTHPTRDLSRLCSREGIEPPVARLISETGRHSRSPVFVVGVYTGDEKLGEGAGSSLDEARIRAAAAAMRCWYLYSPVPDEVMLPSSTEQQGEKPKKKWKPQMIDFGEIIT